jgi:hypothetical protein
MINDPAGLLYAAPHPDSGSITNALLRAALMANIFSQAHGGAAATGVTGLPISAMQYDWPGRGSGVITLVQAGERNTGINEYSFNFQSHYTFAAGRLKGFGLFTGLRAFARNRAYYTQVFPAGGTGSAVQAERVLYRLPNDAVFDLNLSYRRKLVGGAEWTTQLNINNVFDRAEVTLMPNPTNAAQLRARLSNLPRQIIWTNTLRF